MHPVTVGEVEGLIQKLSASWNGRDFDAFCTHYAQDATFVTPGFRLKGREEICRRYKNKFSLDPDAAGILSMLIIEVRTIRLLDTTTVVSAIVEWKLRRLDHEDTGFSLITFCRAEDGTVNISQDASFSRSRLA